MGEPTTAAIVYRSRTGTTRRFAEAIGAFLTTRGVATRVVSIGECDVEALRAADVVLLGCWTEGLFIVRQHPDRQWVAFARSLPELTGSRVGLFTTYKLATGSMFARMREALASTGATVGLELKSRDGSLSDDHRRALERFLAAS